jgi:hypothetical protein
MCNAFRSVIIAREVGVRFYPVYTLSYRSQSLLNTMNHAFGISMKKNELIITQH